MKKLLTIVFMLFCISVMSYGQFTSGKNYLGAAAGLGLEYSTPMFGVNYEYAFSKNFTVGVVARLNKNDDSVRWSPPLYPPSVGKFTKTHMFFGVQGNYHFDGLIKNTQWDPFAGLAVGYYIWYLTLNEGRYFSARGGDDIFYNVHATMRYWLNPWLGVQARFEFGSVLPLISDDDNTIGSSAVLLGIDFRF